MNFLELPCAGHTDCVINQAAPESMRGHNAAGQGTQNRNKMGTAAALQSCASSHNCAARSAPEGSATSGSRSQATMSPIGTARAWSRSSR